MKTHLETEQRVSPRQFTRIKFPVDSHSLVVKVPGIYRVSVCTLYDDLTPEHNVQLRALENGRLILQSFDLPTRKRYELAADRTLPLYTGDEVTAEVYHDGTGEFTLSPAREDDDSQTSVMRRTALQVRRIEGARHNI